MINSHLNLDPPQPSSCSGVPTEFDAVVARGMAKRPDDRYPTVAALAIATRSALNGNTEMLVESSDTAGPAATSLEQRLPPTALSTARPTPVDEVPPTFIGDAAMGAPSGNWLAWSDDALASTSDSIFSTSAPAPLQRPAKPRHRRPTGLVAAAAIAAVIAVTVAITSFVLSTPADGDDSSAPQAALPTATAPAATTQQPATTVPTTTTSTTAPTTVAAPTTYTEPFGGTPGSQQAIEEMLVYVDDADGLDLSTCESAPGLVNRSVTAAVMCDTIDPALDLRASVMRFDNSDEYEAEFVRFYNEIFDGPTGQCGSGRSLEGRVACGYTTQSNGKYYFIMQGSYETGIIVRTGDADPAAVLNWWQIHNPV